MDPNFNECSDSINGFNFDYQTYSPGFIQSHDLASNFNFTNPSLDLAFLDLPSHPIDPDPGTFARSSSSEVDSPDEFSDTVLKYLNQILMEEKMEEKPSMFHDPLALQAAEKSFYEVIGEKYPPLPYQKPAFYTNQSVESPDDNFFGRSSEYSTNSTSTNGGNYIDPQWVGGDSLQNHPSLGYFTNSTLQINSQSSLDSVNSFGSNSNATMDSYVSTTNFVQDIFSDSESILQFKRGMEEASKFLPSYNPLVIDLDKYSLPAESKEDDVEYVVKQEKEDSPNGSRGRKHYYQEDDGFEEERNSKQLAVYVEEVELSEMFDRVLLCTDANGQPMTCEEETRNKVAKPLLQIGQTPTSNGVKNRAKKQGKKGEAVDLRALLISCSQSVAADDRRTANEQLKQIRQHSSPSGDSSQRLAHIFANGLEARLAGTGTQIYAALSAKQISASEKLKAYHAYLSSCPFRKISIFFAVGTIINMSSKASTLHIVDFGIQYGFQWPILIQHLADRPGGPPKLRITGIELPQPGFRPAERLEETGRRLANYCERFSVPFEYNAIASQKWETIKIADLKIRENEFVAVNCLFRFKNLLDETVDLDSPRDAVLKLIGKMNPNIFVHAVINGSHSAPFFVTRFREALFHYSAFFDVFENTLTHDDHQRTNLENAFYGREVMNIIACEGPARVERPETYKQWQVRNMRAGFRPVPLNQELMKKFKSKVTAGYHKDFVFDEDGQWMLQGWKGRILYASSCWVPA
ncbi:hypothetical protein LguiB_000784 [Lonicera macranthoides]